MIRIQACYLHRTTVRAVVPGVAIEVLGDRKIERCIILIEFFELPVECVDPIVGQVLPDPGQMIGVGVFVAGAADRLA
jgi:hypothetical protein